MASAAAGDPSPPPPPPPRGWLSGLVSGAGRLLAAVLDAESSASDTTYSSPESSQSPPRCAFAAAEDGSGMCFASDSYLNLSGKEIVLKDSSIVSEIDPKGAVKQLLMQDTYSRSECDALIKIIEERVVDSDPGVDEPEIILPIAWHECDTTQQHPVEYSSNPSTVKKELPKKTSTNIKGLGTKNHGRSNAVRKRSYSSTGATFEQSPRRVKLKPHLSGTSGKNDKCTVGNDSSSASKLMLQGDIEAAPSSSMGLQPVNSSKNFKRGFNLERGIPTKRRSPATASRTRPPNDRKTARSWNGPPQMDNLVAPPAGQKADAGRTQAKRPVGRPRKEWR